MQPSSLFLSVGLVMALSACKLPDINLATPKPIEVNLNMRLDVYQFSGDAPQDTEKAKSLAEASERMRNRQSEVQELKNNRLIGEDHRGLVHLREVPGGKWGDRVKQVVQEENDDRLLVMRDQAQKSNRTLIEVQQEQWKLRSAKAFKGEWIEIAGEKEGTYKWVQAEGPKEKE
jgi:hypothetical protein